MIRNSLVRTFSALVLFGLASLSAAEVATSKSEKPQRVAFGEKINLEDYVVPGKTTIFDFTSEFCPPCREMSPHLDQLHAKRDDVVVVKIDINRPKTTRIDWASPVAKQYGIRQIPQFKVYGPDGKLSAKGDQASELVNDWIEKSGS